MDLTALYNSIEAESSNAYGEDDDLASTRAAAIDRYLGKNVIPAPDGRSQVVDRSVYETIQWIQPSLARIFANGDDVVDVVPVGPEDEPGAKQEGQYLNYVIMQRNNWPQVFDTGSKSALMTKGGYLYAYKKLRRQIEVEKYEKQTAEALALILEGDPDILEHEEYPDESAPQMTQDPMTGQPVPMPPQMLHDVQIRRVKEEPQFCIEVLPPERCRISKRCKTIQLDGCPYFEYHDWPTISELRQDGIDIPDDVETGDDPVSPYDSAEDSSRNILGESDEDATDPAMRRIYTRWCWIAHDTDGDGIAELQYCIVAGGEVRHREEVTRIPVAVLCPDPLPFRHVGLCPADVCSDIQDIKTSIMRGALDNLQLTNNTRMFVSPMINLDDVLINRPGSVIRGKQGAVYGQDIAPIMVPSVFPQAMEAYGFMEQVNEGRTGVNRYFQGTDQNALNKTSSGIQQLSSMAAQRVEHVARMYAPGIVELFSILHELILKAGKFQDRIKLNGNWVTIDPSQWRKRNDFRISVGFAAGNKDAMMARLQQIAMFQAQALQAGLPIVNPRNAYETMIELTKAADLSTPERFWTDPATVQPQPPPPNPQLEVEQVKGQFALQEKQMDSQTKVTVAQIGAQTELQKASLEGQVKFGLADHAAQVGAVMQDSQHNQTREIEQGRSQSQLRLASMKQPKPETKADPIAGQLSELQEGLANMSQLLLELGKALTGRRVLERGPDGRPMASRLEP
jgi:hypothetical protein